MKTIFFLSIVFLVTITNVLGYNDNNYNNNFYGDYYLSLSSKLVSLDLENVQLVDVLKMLSQQTGFNFISTEAVKERKLTLYLDKVPLKDAMDIIFKANNLSYDYYPESNMFVVKEMGKPSVELITKVYRLKYVRVSYSRLQQEINKRVGTVQKTSDQSSQQAGNGVGIKTAVEKVLSEFGKVTEDPLTNSLIVTDVPARFPLIEEIISKLDIPLPMVMIETEMLDVSKSVLDKLGVNWPDALFKLGVTGTRGVNFPFTGHVANLKDVLIKYEKGSWVGAPDVTQSLSGFQLENWPLTKFTPTILTVVGTDLVLRYLKGFSDTKSIARPKIMTMANETAEIKITTNEAIGVTKSVSETGGATYTVEREETGTRLRVTPQVDLETGEITLFVETFTKDTKESVFKVTEAIGTGTIQNPEERSATAVARLKDGQTLLIGGLITRRTSEQKSKLPFLGDVPILGMIFRGRTSQDSERELLVFLTPRIVKPQQSFLKTVDLQRERSSFKRELVRIALDKYSR